jgi:anti-sigma regulatory factor (Ser/Thr protein kinase)
VRTTRLLGSIELPPKTSSVTFAREHVRGLLSTAGHQETDNIELLAGEFVANAVNHSKSGRNPSGTVELRIYHNGETVRVEVIDKGSTGTIPRIPKQVDPLSEVISTI